MAMKLGKSNTIAGKLQVFVNRCLRKICCIFFPDVISNENLLTLTAQIPVSTEIGRRKWKWIGHTLRKKPPDIAYQAMSWRPPGKRKPGGQFATWQSSVRREAAQQGVVWNQLSHLAENRVRWKSFVDTLRFIEE